MTSVYGVDSCLGELLASIEIGAKISWYARYLILLLGLLQLVYIRWGQRASTSVCRALYERSIVGKFGCVSSLYVSGVLWHWFEVQPTTINLLTGWWRRRVMRPRRVGCEVRHLLLVCKIISVDTAVLTNEKIVGHRASRAYEM